MFLIYRSPLYRIWPTKPVFNNSHFFCCSVPPPPLVMWAQRPTLVFLTFCLEDCKEPEIKVDADKLHFKGVGGTEKKVHEVTINFFKEIDPEVTANLNQFHMGIRNIPILW